VRPRRKWEANIKMDNKTQDVRMWSGFDWLRIDSSGGLL
jgi:hypothetical protein